MKKLTHMSYYFFLYPMLALNHDILIQPRNPFNTLTRLGSQFWSIRIGTWHGNKKIAL